MTVLLGQVLYTSFTGLGFKCIVSPSVPDIAEQIFREKIVEARWLIHSPPPREWRAAYVLQLESSKTIFGWVYHDGRDEYGRDNVPYFFAYYLHLPIDRVILDLILAFLGKGPGTVPSREFLPTPFDDVAAPELWSYVPQRPGVFIDIPVRENAYRVLQERRSVDLFVAAPSEPLLLEFDEQICELLSLLLAQLAGPSSKTLVRRVVEGSASVPEPKQRILHVLDSLVAEFDDELGKAEFIRRAKAVLGIVGPQG
jgi:hypothetical protein